jgi:hypothetical protein
LVLMACFGVLVVALAPEAPAQGGGGGTDRVFYRDRAREGQVSVVSGETKESAAGIVVSAGGKTLKTIPAMDIVRVEYSRLPGLEDADRFASNSDESKELRDAKDVLRIRNDAAARLKKTPSSADAKTRRFLEFRDAMWAARLADARSGADFATEAATAIKLLTGFVQLNGKSWEAWPASMTAARLNAELSLTGPDAKGNPAAFNAAASSLAVLSKNAALPADLRAEAKVLEAEMLLRTGNTLAVEPVLQGLTTDKDIPATGPLRDRVMVMVGVVKSATPADATKVVEAMLVKSADVSVRAVARAALGEYFLQKGKPREAMWEFLWPATVYTEDRERCLFAHLRLVSIFEQLGDKARADDFREKISRLKS